MRFSGGLGATAVAWLLGVAVAVPGAATVAAAAAAAPDDATAAAAAAPPEPAFVSFGVGVLPRGVVASLAQDTAGFLWVSTGDGLVRFDGMRFRPQGRAVGDPVARNLGWNHALLAGCDGRVWIGTENRGVAVYEPETARIRDVQPARPGKRPMVLALAEDRDGAVWVGTLGGGLQRIDAASGEIAEFRAGSGTGLPDDRVTSLHVGRDGTLWVGTWRGLVRRRPGAARFETLAPAPGAALPAAPVGSVMAADDGSVWVGDHDGRLWRVDAGTGQAQALGAGDAAAVAGTVTALRQVPGGRVWVGRRTGLDIHDAASGRLLRRLQHDVRRPAGLAGDHVTALLVDHDGGIWVGGIGLGLQRHDPANVALRVVDPTAGAGDPSLGRSVRSVLQLDDGQVWLAAPEGGVRVMTSQLEPVVPRQPLRPPGWPAATVEAMAQMRDGSVRVVAGGELLQVDRRRRVLDRRTLAAGEPYCLLSTRDGTLWLCAQGGLFRIGAGEREPRRVDAAGGTPTGTVFKVAETDDGSLWVGTIGGLYRLPAGGDRLQPVAAAPGAGLSSPLVHGLLLDRDGVLWLDTAVGGLHRLLSWDGRQARFDRVSERHGIVGPPFGVNLMQDALGRIWTQQFVYDPGADRIDELRESDGKHFGAGWFHAYARTADGRFLFGGTRGLLVVQPVDYALSTKAAPVRVASLRIDGVDEPSPPRRQSLHLRPGHSGFSLEFAAIDYSDPSRIRYAYRLAGHHPDWIQTSARERVATYGQLAPGDYRLHVRAIDRSGIWSPHELELAIHVEAAWWQLPFVRAAGVALALLGVWGLVHWRTRQLRRHQHVLEGKVRDRTAALHEASMTDPLTGLRNRRYFTEHIGADVAVALRRHEQARETGAAPPADADLLFFLVDIDHFKEVNDRHGHAAGDAVLRQVQDRLRPVFRDTDHLVRWGGEEFLIVARATSREHAADLAERARRAIGQQPFDLGDGVALRRSASIGFACLPLWPARPRAPDWHETLGLADAALYEAKRDGRDRWVGVVGAATPPAPAPDAANAAADRRSAAAWLASGELVVQRG